MNKRILLLAALAFAAVACGDDDGESTPPPVLRPDGGGITPAIDAGNGGLDATTPTNDSGADAGGNNPPVNGAPGCFAGKATTNKDLLNSCAEGFVDFNDTQRLPGYTGGRATVSN